MKSKAQIMKTAWQIRKAAAAKYGVKVSEILFAPCLKMAWSQPMEKTQLQKVQDAVQQYEWTAKEWKNMILIINRKNEMVGHVKPTGEVVEKFVGRRNMMGKLAYQAIRAAL